MKALLVVAALAGALTLAIVSCGPSDPPQCTPDKAGRGGAATLTTRELPAPLAGEGDCKLYVKLVRSDDELLAEYQRMGLAPKGDAGPDADFSLPEVQWLKESVVVYGSDKPEGVRWAVKDGNVVVLGLQSCFESGGQCSQGVMAVSAVATKAEVFRCDAPSCAGVAPQQ